MTYDAKSVRLDVYVDDGKDTVFDLEMQTTNPQNLPKRTRYYHGMIDLNLLEKGENYNKLKKSFVIFICTEDIFGKGKPIYSFENYCKEYDISLMDESYTVIVNASAKNSGDLELRNFLRYVISGEITDRYTRELAGEVNRVKQNHMWEEEFMTLEMIKNQEREIGEETGIEIGKAQMSVLAVNNLAQNQKCSIEDACSILGITLEQYHDSEKLLETYNQ